MFRARRRTVVTATAVVAVLLGGALAATLLTQGGDSASGTTVTSGNSVTYAAGHRPLAPGFTATSLTGAPVRLSSYRGKTLVLNFWGSWCAPCRSEASTLEVLAQQYRAQGVAFLGDDVADTTANALAFTQSHGVSYPSINDPGYAVVQQFREVAPVSSTPVTVVIDKTGRVVGFVVGAVSYGEMTTLLHQAAVTS